jgi:hypothetical protein
MSLFNNFNRSSKAYPLRYNNKNKSTISTQEIIPKSSVIMNNDLLQQLMADKIEFGISSDDEGGVGDVMAESEDEGKEIIFNKRIKGISPEALLSVSEGLVPCKTKTDNTELQANPSASIVGSSKDHPSKCEVNKTDSVFDRDVSRVDRCKSRISISNNRSVTRQRLKIEVNKSESDDSLNDNSDS